MKETMQWHFIMVAFSLEKRVGGIRRDSYNYFCPFLQEYQKVVDAEWTILYNKLEKIVQSGAKVVLSKLPIGDVATQYFADRQVRFIDKDEAGMPSSDSYTWMRLACLLVLVVVCCCVVYYLFVDVVDHFGIFCMCFKVGGRGGGMDMHRTLCLTRSTKESFRFRQVYIILVLIILSILPGPHPLAEPFPLFL